MGIERDKRLAANESIFREINEQQEAGHQRFGLTGPQEFVCECADVSCTERVHLTRDDYEGIRSNPRRFVIVRGHDVPDIEDVVEAHGDYAVVEKDSVAAEVAEDRDPRAS